MLKLVMTSALVLVALFVVLRIVRKRRGRNYGESKKDFEKRLLKTSAQTREHTLSAGVAEQILPIAAAIRELLDLAGNPAGFVLLEDGRTVRLQIPAGEIRIDFGFSHTHTALRHKAGRRQVCWRISGPGTEEREFTELADTVAHVKRVIFQQNEKPVLQP